MASEPRGRSLVVECITIVFGILLAFAIDAAWNSRREREERSSAAPCGFAVQESASKPGAGALWSSACAAKAACA